MMLIEQPIDVTGLLSSSVGMVPAHMVNYVWPRVLEILCTKGQKWLEVVDENDIYQLLISGQADLWCGTHNAETECVAICMIERHRRASYYHVCFLGGTNLHKYLKQGLSKLEQYAALTGSSELVLEGRKGFSRMLKPFGYHTNTVRLRKPVSVLWRN